MPRGIPRAKEMAGFGAAAPTVEQETVKPPEEIKTWKRNSFEDLRLEDCEPYFEGDALPDAKVEYHETKNRDGQIVVTRSIWCGQPKFYLERNPNGWLNLIAKYKNGKGVATRNIRTLKPRDPNKMMGMHPLIQERARKDKQILDQLRKQGVPERHTGQ